MRRRIKDVSSTSRIRRDLRRGLAEHSKRRGKVTDEVLGPVVRGEMGGLGHVERGEEVELGVVETGDEGRL